MEAEIERLYQIVEELTDKLEKIQKENTQINLSILDLDQKVESIRRVLTTGMDI